MTKKGTSSVKLPEKNYGLIRVWIVDKFPQLEPHFYNQRLLNQFKNLLRSNGVECKSHRKGRGLDVVSYGVYISADDSGRFTARGRHFLRGSMYVSFEANNTFEIIHKLLRFRIISGQTAKRFVTWGEQEKRPIQNRRITKDTKKRLALKNQDQNSPAQHTD